MFVAIVANFRAPHPADQQLAAGLAVLDPAAMQRTNDQLVLEVLDAGRSIHKSLGPGFVESVYSKAMTLEMKARGLSVEREKLIRVVYAECVVGRHYLDMVVEGRLILELKATRVIIPVFEAQMLSYLTASEYAMGLILNFGTTDLEWKPVQIG
jgi:GxxExxY protein